MDKEVLLKKLNDKLRGMSEEEFIKHLEQNGIAVEKPKESILINDSGNCPHCDWHCNDEYIQIKGRFINDRYYDTQRCSKCGKLFDKIYELKLLRSQSSLSTNRIVKEGY